MKYYEFLFRSKEELILRNILNSSICNNCKENVEVSGSISDTSEDILKYVYPYIKSLILKIKIKDEKNLLMLTNIDAALFKTYLNQTIKENNFQSLPHEYEYSLDKLRNEMNLLCSLISYNEERVHIHDIFDGLIEKHISSLEIYGTDICYHPCSAKELLQGAAPSLEFSKMNAMYPMFYVI